MSRITGQTQNVTLLAQDVMNLFKVIIAICAPVGGAGSTQPHLDETSSNPDLTNSTCRRKFSVRLLWSGRPPACTSPVQKAIPAIGHIRSDRLHSEERSVDMF